MRYLNVILTIVAIFLAFISLRLYHIEILVENSLQQNQVNLVSYNALASSNEKVLRELDSLKGKVEEPASEVPKKQKEG